MRAWVADSLGEPREVMRIADVPVPSVGPDQVLISVEATGLNFPDLLQLRGGYQVKPAFPMIVGSEVAGIVEAVGADVDPSLVGTRVAATVSGGLAESAVARAGALHPVPEGVESSKVAALLSNYTTTFYALHDRARLVSGETLLVTAAAGGVGSAAVQLGRAAGARVIAAVGSREKADFVRSLGADDVVVYGNDDIVEVVRDMTDGAGVDVVYDPVGGDVFDAARRTVAFDGRYLIIGFTSGRIPEAPANHILLKNYSMVGVHWGAAIARNPERMSQIMVELTALLVSGRIDPPLHRDGPVPFVEAAEMLARLGERGTVGKVVVAGRG